MTDVYMYPGKETEQLFDEFVSGCTSDEVESIMQPLTSPVNWAWNPQYVCQYSICNQ
jgi:hypothetical protein